MIGKTLGHYQITEKLGAGGMGEVYLGFDQHLQRQVAIKVLPSGMLGDDQARKRFHNEALALSRLNHPGIAAVYDFDSQEGVDFLAMEYVPGTTLSDCLASGPLPEPEVIAVGVQIAAALEEAHENGVVHRDLKPGNIILTPKKQVKVLDFGLAKLLQPTSETASAETLTQTQGIAGTLPYMAPEQLLGQAVDARSDIWALGVVLYEMAGGVRPFQGQTGFELSSAILNQPPPPLSSQVPAELRALIERCLEKDPGRRYQKASEVRMGLEAIQTGGVAPWVVWRYRLARRRWLSLTATAVILLLIVVALSLDRLQRRFWGGMPQIQSLAVLPLENLSGDKEQEYFADGMTEELITNLAKISALKVISRTSTMQYKGTKKPAAQIAKELNVDGLIEGSVLREGGQLRIMPKLILASTGQIMWADSYQREMRGVLVLQGEIASAIADKVRAAVTPTERARLTSARPVNPEAYDACLKGGQHVLQITPQDYDMALRYYELALKIDPNYAPAYAGVSAYWSASGKVGFTAPREAGPKAKAAALKALELDNTLAAAHSSLALAKHFYEWDWVGAEREYKRSFELNPNDAGARATYSFYLINMKRPEEGMAEIQRALELDPLNTWLQAVYGDDLVFAGRDDEALVQYQKALRTSSGLTWAHLGLSGILFRKAKYEESWAETKAYYAGDREMEDALTQGYAQSGYRGAMRRAADTLAARARKTYMLPSDVAGLYMMAGEKAQALAWLEKGLEMRDFGAPQYGLDPTFETLRSTPRFQEIVRRLNLPS